ncbi:MAG: cheY 2 [Gemmataceae bacterium]|nr:cheY 2 [Gemmataceae bacterium]
MRGREEALADTSGPGGPGEGGFDEVPEALRPLAAALGPARTVEQVAEALVTHGLPALDACVAVLALLSEDGTEFYCPRVAGYPEDVADAWRRFPADAPVPIAEAVREGRPVLLDTLEQRAAYYPPGLALPANRVGRALAAVPMRRGDVVGGLGFTFPDDRAFGAGERAALLVVADLCAAALGRVRRGGLGCEVLVADDEPALLAMLDFALRFHGFAVRRAAGGEAAVRAFGRHRRTVDVALLDVQMPGMDGPRTLAALREIDPAMRCVFMSGDTGPYTAEQLLALGAVRVLPKPFAGIDAVIRVLRETARG